CDYLVRFLIIARPPRPPLFPYTTLFRSMDGDVDLATAQRILEGRHERTIAELADRSRALVARGGYDDELRVITDARRDEASLRKREGAAARPHADHRDRCSSSPKSSRAAAARPGTARSAIDRKSTRLNS